MELGFHLGLSPQDDAFVVDSDGCSLNYQVNDDYDDRDFDEDFVSGVPLFWDSLQLEGRPGVGDWRVDVDVEWEEIDGWVDEGEVPRMIFDVERGFCNDVIDQVGDGVVDRVAGADGMNFMDPEVVGNLEWEVVYELGFDSALDDETTGQPIFFHDDDADFYAAEYELMFGRSMNGLFSTVETLERTTVVCSQDEDERDCAICQDGLHVGEEATKMPCDHFFHGECISTWLRIRNTCPVCRFTLPTTDHADYSHTRI